ncbi:hypothetical protein NE237_006890 [Protea cynaroides]|uniref:Uncharacterized protein n=1 Tax=Protea cynaroides TaxID=273540 RepID=A0A9Q0KP44_9MAGN|nr:hypothetical protein NE237_006890 [Protea cynaroides]
MDPLSQLVKAYIFFGLARRTSPWPFHSQGKFRSLYLCCYSFKSIIFTVKHSISWQCLFFIHCNKHGHVLETCFGSTKTNLRLLILSTASTWNGWIKVPYRIRWLFLSFVLKNSWK